MAFLWNKRLASPTRVNTPEETPVTTYKPHSNPKKNVVLSIYERHQQVLTLPENSVFFCNNSYIWRQRCYYRYTATFACLTRFHITRFVLAPFAVSKLKTILLQFWNSTWRCERNACDVKKRTVKFPSGLSKRSFFVSTKSTFLPSHQNRYQIAVKLTKNRQSINQSTNQSIDHWFMQSFSESIFQSVKQSILIKSNQWNSQSVSQSIRQSHSQSFMKKWVSQSARTP